MNEFWKTIPHTMFDFADFYDWVADKLPYNSNIAEVGVADGASAIFLAEKLDSINKTYLFRMIDSMAYGGYEQMKTIMDNVRIARCKGGIDVLPVDSLNASCKFPDQYFDFVFIDSGHTYELTKAEIVLWWKKVKHGGMLAGHDYNSAENPGVKQALQEIVTPIYLNEWHSPAMRSANSKAPEGVWTIIKAANINIFK
jgi:predicted O-methyltransferase YrrM